MVIQTFVAQPYQVQQPSMENTLMPDQYVLVDKLTPRFDDYHRGDIIVLNPPAGWSQDSNATPYIKRVIGVGGETVDIHGGHVYIDGNMLVEPYIYEGQSTDMPDGGTRTWKLAPDQLFVMGDHRQVSQDSRDFGPVKKSSVIGRAWLRYWPSSQFGLIPPGKPSSSGSPHGSSSSSGSSPVQSTTP
jgi:signal peptidase I